MADGPHLCARCRNPASVRRPCPRCGHAPAPGSRSSSRRRGLSRPLRRAARGASDPPGGRARPPASAQPRRNADQPARRGAPDGRARERRQPARDRHRPARRTGIARARDRDGRRERSPSLRRAVALGGIVMVAAALISALSGGTPEQRARSWESHNPRVYDRTGGSGSV